MHPVLVTLLGGLVVVVVIAYFTINGKGGKEK